MWRLVLFGLAALVFSMPVIPALLEWRQMKDARPLRIVPTHVNDVRQLADNFRALVQEALAKPQSSAAAEYLMDEDLLAPTQEGVPVVQAYGQGEQRYLVAMTSIALRDACTLSCELYGRENIVAGADSCFRALYAEGDLVLGQGCVLLRWAHARSVRIGPNCSLLGRLSAQTEIRLAPGSRFTRVNAQTITTGIARPGDDRSEPQAEMRGETHSLAPAAHAGRRFVDGRFKGAPEEIIDGDLIVYGDTRIGAGSHVLGSIKSHGRAVLEHGVRVSGAVVCAASLHVGEDCTLAGPLIAEEAIEVERGGTVGTLNRPTTMSANTIHLARGVRVHGSLHARIDGRVI